MRTILYSEINNERCNAAALGLYNASVEESYYNKIQGNADVESKIFAAKELKRLGITDNIELKLNAKIKDGSAWVEMPVNGDKVTRIVSSKNPERAIIGHEMTHVKQNISGKMQVKDGYIYWEGKKNISVKVFNKITKNLRNPNNYMKYKNFPWEKEAYNRSDELNHMRRITKL
ncbi:MAG: hypothetical protein ACRC0E_07345 [Soonwooa sp.]